MKTDQEIEIFINKAFNLFEDQSIDFIRNMGNDHEKGWIEINHGVYSLDFLNTFSRFLEATRLVISSDFAGTMIDWRY